MFIRNFGFKAVAAYFGTIGDKIKPQCSAYRKILENLCQVSKQIDEE